MKGLSRSKRLLDHDLPGDSSQENKGEALHAPVDNDDDDEEDVDNDHARLRKCATEGAFSLTDLNRLALKPGLTANELADGFWNLQGRLEEDDPKHKEPKDTFVNNIILGRNLEVFLEVSKFLPFGKGIVRQLIFAAVRIGDEEAAVRLVSMLHSQGYEKLRDVLLEALAIHLPAGAPHSGARGLVKEILRLKISSPHYGPVTSHSCESFNECFRVFWCSRHALTAIDEVLGPEMWDVVRRDRPVALTLKTLDAFDMSSLARNGVLEYLLRRKALVLTPEVCDVISQGTKLLPRTSEDISNPYILSFIDFYNDTLLPVINAMVKKKREPVQLSNYAQSVCTRIREYYPSMAEPSLEVDGFLDWVESHLNLRDSRECLQTEELICTYMRTGAVDRLHSLLELLVPAESSCTMLEDGLLDEPRPPPHAVKKRAEMVINAICEQGNNSRLRYVGLPIQHYLFHELQLDIEQVCNYCELRVIYLGPTSPPTLVVKVLQMAHANFPKLDIDQWKELFKQGVYPVPAYFGNRVNKGVQSLDAFRESLKCPHVNVHLVCGKKLRKSQDHETLEYLRPWYRVCGTMLTEETKFSMREAVRWCWQSDCRAQAMVEADMIRISDELREKWCRKETKSVGLIYGYLSKNYFPIYFKWYPHTKDQDIMRGLQVVLFATACATNRISEAKRVLLDMLQPPSGQDPWVQVSSSRAYLLAMAACTRNLPFVKWVFSQIQAAFSLEPSGKLKDLNHVSGPDRAKIERRNHELTMSAWLDFMMIIIHVEEVHWNGGFREQEDRSYDPLMHLTDHVLDPPCPKYFMETGLLLAQTDPLAVLPLIFRIIIMTQIDITWWTCRDTRGFYDMSFDSISENDCNFGASKENRWHYGTNPAWAWGPITLVKLIELIADEPNGTADTILNAKEQTEGIGVEGSKVFSLNKSDDTDADGDNDDGDNVDDV